MAHGNRPTVPVSFGAGFLLGVLILAPLSVFVFYLSPLSRRLGITGGDAIVYGFLAGLGVAAAAGLLFAWRAARAPAEGDEETDG